MGALGKGILVVALEVHRRDNDDHIPPDLAAHYCADIHRGGQCILALAQSDVAGTDAQNNRLGLLNCPVPGLYEWSSPGPIK